MLSLFESIVLGGLQGLTELFPISSLGHTVILPTLLGWDINQEDPLFLSFIVATHLATAIVLFFFYFQDWMRIIGGVLRSMVTFKVEPGDTHTKMGWLLVIATIPAGILGLLFEEKFEMLFASPKAAATFLLLNGVLLFGAELLRRKRETHEGNDENLARMSWKQALFIGVMQCLALLPGFSRTGATVAGGLMQKLSHIDAARFSFLMATPIIGAAAVLKLPALIHVHPKDVSIILIGSICSGIMAYISVRFLSYYFKTETLTPFAVYCVLFATIAIIFF